MRDAGALLLMLSRAFAGRVVLVASAADGADGAAVGVHQHPGADALRRRPLGGDDGDQRRLFAPLEGLEHSGEDGFVHEGIIARRER